MLKRNSIKVHSNTRDHTDSSHYRNENQLAVWVILEIFERFRLKPAGDRPEYWLSAICQNVSNVMYKNYKKGGLHTPRFVGKNL